MNAQTATNEYVLDNSWDRAGRRLAGLESTYDPGTQRRADALGLRPGWACLEVGAGSGSIARWLAERVGPDGSVVAADINTSALVDLPDNVEVRQLDLRVDPLPESAFDLVHARLVLCHLAEREEVLDKLVAALRPGGRLLLEEADVFAMEALPLDAAATVHSRVTQAFVAFLRGTMDLHLGRRLPAMVGRRGLTDISVECEAPLSEGGSIGAEWLRLTIDQIAEQTDGEIMDAVTLQQWHELLSERGRWFPNLALVTAAGTRPEA